MTRERGCCLEAEPLRTAQSRIEPMQRKTRSADAGRAAKTKVEESQSLEVGSGAVEEGGWRCDVRVEL